MTGLFILIGILAGLKIVLDRWVFDKQRERRRTYHRDTYLSSDDWKRKRSLVLKRHRYRYARRNIGREPIEWLVSVCKSCHEKQHERA